MTLEVCAHAKINWSLSICGERLDGYHELDMLMQRIELCDELCFAPAPQVELWVDGRRAPDGERNLIVRAVRALNAACGLNMGARIELKKRIPARAGLGGGSADCAAALRALNRLWGLKLPLSALMEIGLKLGADVPFCLADGPARVRGIGEQLEPCPLPGDVPLALVTPGGGLSTPEVFRAWGAGGHSMTPPHAPELAEALRAGDLRGAQRLAQNDLEAPAVALMPEIAEISARFRALGAPFVRMTGSGSTVFAAFEREADARAAAAQIPNAIFSRTLAGGAPEELSEEQGPVEG